jgi:tRNA nucleotidyltransferase/poly(A) polymerase
MVSRQRVEAELIKILRGKITFLAFQLMHELHLYNPVFYDALPCAEDERPSCVLWHTEWYGPRHAEWARAFETVALLLSGGPNTLRNILLQPEKMEDIWMLTAFVPMDIGQLDDLAERELANLFLRQ